MQRLVTEPENESYLSIATYSIPFVKQVLHGYMHYTVTDIAIKFIHSLLCCVHNINHESLGDLK